VIFSVHNYFPVPDILLPSQGSGDAFLMTSLEESERRAAVDYTGRSLRIAGELGARFLVVHLGEVECGSMGRELVRIYRETGRSEAFLRARRSLVEERQKKRQAHLDRLYASLETILKTAEELGLVVCVENRFYPHQIPSFDEAGLILNRFEGGPIRYWHDVGHGMVQEHLGLTPHLDWLNRYGMNLAGIHLHDAVGIRDHLAPGRGEISFEEYRPFLNERTAKIVEVHPFVETDDLRSGIDQLRRDLGI
ncbi:MAG: hypothetical protein A2Z06_04520, partial [Candidatus Glassbacteria bacterium RBG_16_58_8]